MGSQRSNEGFAFCFHSPLLSSTQDVFRSTPEEDHGLMSLGVGKAGRLDRILQSRQIVCCSW